MSEYIHEGQKNKMNIRIYSLKKINKYLSKWIYSSINILIYLNIRIFATHWNNGYDDGDDGDDHGDDGGDDGYDDGENGDYELMMETMI